MIAISPHTCVSSAGDPFGELDPQTNVAVCRERKGFPRPGGRYQAISAGCGKTFALCRTCGNRNVVDGAQCGQCIGSHANNGARYVQDVRL